MTNLIVMIWICQGSDGPRWWGLGGGVEVEGGPVPIAVIRLRGRSPTLVLFDRINRIYRIAWSQGKSC